MFAVFSPISHLSLVDCFPYNIKRWAEKSISSAASHCHRFHIRIDASLIKWNALQGNVDNCSAGRRLFLFLFLPDILLIINAFSISVFPHDFKGNTGVRMLSSAVSLQKASRPESWYGSFLMIKTNSIDRENSNVWQLLPWHVSINIYRELALYTGATYIM